MRDYFGYIVVNDGYAQCIGTRAYCLRYILQHGIRRTAYITED